MSCKKDNKKIPKKTEKHFQLINIANESIIKIIKNDLAVSSIMKIKVNKFYQILPPLR